MGKPVSIPSTEGIRSDWESARSSIFVIAASTAVSTVNAVLSIQRLLAGDPNHPFWLPFVGTLCGVALIGHCVSTHRRLFYPKSLTPKP